VPCPHQPLTGVHCRPPCGYPTHPCCALDYVVVALGPSVTLTSQHVTYVPYTPIVIPDLPGCDKYGQVLVLGSVGFGEEGKGIVQVGQLSALVCLAEIHIVHSFDDFLRDMSSKVLVRVGSSYQPVPHSAFHDVFLLSDSIVGVLGSLG